MVQFRKIVCGALACLLVAPCHAADNDTYVITTSPIYDTWEDDTGAVNNMTLILGVINADYACNWTSDGTLASTSTSTDTVSLEKRKMITITSVVTTVKFAADIISIAKAVESIYEYIGGIIWVKSDIDTCTLTYGTDMSGDYYYGYAYKATTTDKNCDTTAEKKTIITAVENCAKKLNKKGATVGCCAFSHGGTWSGHLRLSADPSLYPVRTVDC
ncbi:hypothetical protein BO70DRAFT_286194 [Aspergillus heteromorphus CBS 117.55]|uniref:Secreted protein CSS2 C-terminal domain-containing protein n=1 Tax=Aspergillus heteromorphus CBS 117.55 TaxID=1448321 RepID=A0A317WP68_9EURO|nr:uncharacterized protein BO70DRAFT_286194 [Aspergillus heteromorphus CBS 117.55]PWY88193.1 hypothetical protein BO70DRAFT_286194 [Aspergillus heteromorphus CBS 117.55]